MLGEGFVQASVIELMHEFCDASIADKLQSKEVYRVYSALHAVIVHVLPAHELSSSALLVASDVDGRVSWLLDQPLPAFIIWFVRLLRDQGKMKDFFTLFFPTNNSLIWAYKEEDVLAPAWLQTMQPRAAKRAKKQRTRRDSGTTSFSEVAEDEEAEESTTHKRDTRAVVPAPSSTRSAGGAELSQEEAWLEERVVLNGAAVIALDEDKSFSDFMHFFKKHSVSGTTA